MPKEENLRLDGKVLEALPNATFICILNDNDQKILAHLSGKMRKNFIKVLPGDDVIIEMSPYDLTKGRIVFRGKI